MEFLSVRTAYLSKILLSDLEIQKFSIVFSATTALKGQSQPALIDPLGVQISPQTISSRTGAGSSDDDDATLSRCRTVVRSNQILAPLGGSGGGLPFATRLIVGRRNGASVHHASGERRRLLVRAQLVHVHTRIFQHVRGYDHRRRHPRHR